MLDRYKEIYGKLTFETATVIFVKNNGEIRCMLATRNLDTAGIAWGMLNTKLIGHDKRCNINNGNISVIDLEIGEPRSFNVERLVSIYYHGEILDSEGLEGVMGMHKEFKDKYNAEKPRQVGIDDLG